MNRVSVLLNGEKVSTEPGISIAEFFGHERISSEGIVAARLDNHLVALDTRVIKKATITPVFRQEQAGRVVVKRSISHMLHTVAAACFPGLNLLVGQSLFGGYFYELSSQSQEPLPEMADLVQALNEGLQALIAERRPFESFHAPIQEALEVLTDPDGSKARLLEVWINPLVPLVRLDGFCDIPHGPYALHTGIGKGARVVAYPPGIILQFPNAAIPTGTARLLWDCYVDTRQWCKRLNVESVGSLNRVILQDGFDDVIRISEGLHEKKITNIADEITQRIQQVRVVLISGPSSAGKTTFVRRLSIQLKVNGIEPVIIGLDDYFRDRENCPRGADGDYDFEALEALNLPLVHEHLTQLLAGKTVLKPSFSFHTGKSSFPGGTPISLKPQQVLLIEGIHGLNPILTQPVPQGAAYRIFTNALTQLVMDAHNRILTSDMRLLRRIVRDRLFRGTNAADTLGRWERVRQGEKIHIFPYQDMADAMFNSSLVYETAVLKNYATSFLLEVPRGHPSRSQVHRILDFLSFFVPVLPQEVPSNSVLREFIGGSSFNY